MSRTRLLRPAFFTDERMARLSIETRYIYAGLWTLADDAGYFERRPGEIAVAIFPFDAHARRQKRVDRALVDLEAEERIAWLDCNDHGIIPRLSEHGVISGGNHAYTIRDKHKGQCELTLFRARQMPLKLTTSGKNIPSQVREAVRFRDAGRCRYCRTETDRLDHLDNFGTGSIDNVVVCCAKCNHKKGARSAADAGMVLLPEPDESARAVYASGRSRVYGPVTDTPVPGSGLDSGSGSDSDSTRAEARGMSPLDEAALAVGGWAGSHARREAS